MQKGRFKIDTITVQMPNYQNERAIDIDVKSGERLSFAQ